MRENIIKEKYSGGLVGYFGQDITIYLLMRIITSHHCSKMSISLYIFTECVEWKNG